MPRPGLMEVSSKDFGKSRCHSFFLSHCKNLHKFESTVCILAARWSVVADARHAR